MKDYTQHINKKADILTDNGDVVVTDGKKEVFRMPRNKQTVSIANSIYMSAKYGDCADHPTEKVCTGKRCPMQVGYDVKNCKDKDCIYRTETEKGGVEE